MSQTAYTIVAERLAVSRETHAAFTDFLALLQKWQRAKNLVATSTLDDAWDRHVADCLQLCLHTSLDEKRLVDLGSGAGLPGLILAIYARQSAPTARITLVEANHKKVAFLREAARTLRLAAVSVKNSRVEDVMAAGDARADIVTARALAALDVLLPWGAALLKPHGELLLLKGRSAEDEEKIARQGWDFQSETHSSLTSPEAVVMRITGINPRHEQ